MKQTKTYEGRRADGSGWTSSLFRIGRHIFDMVLMRTTVQFMCLEISLNRWLVFVYLLKKDSEI